MSNSFVTSFTADGGARVQLLRAESTGFLRRPRTVAVPPADWAALTEDKIAASAMLISEHVENDRARIEDGAIILLPRTVALLSESEAAAIGLPPAAPIALALRSSGLVIDESFRIMMRWTRLDGSDVAARVIGAQAKIEGSEFRLPEPLFSLRVMADAVNGAPDVSTRQSAFAELRGALEKSGTDVSIDSSLAEMRIAFAGNFSLALHSKDRGLDFDPVLFAPRIGGAATEGVSVDQNADMLLTPKQQEGFARAFRRSPAGRRAYLLPDGLLLFVDPSLAPVLDVVRRAQALPEGDRRRFAASPRRAIEDALGVEGVAETLFVETVQYSERVTGIDPWRQPVLPWVKQKPNSWFPESFGLKVGDDPAIFVEIAPEDVEELATAVETAIETGQPTVDYRDDQIPATTASLGALRDLRELAQAEKTSDQGAEPPPVARERLFLQVRDNLETVEYAPLTRVTAPADMAVVLPKGVRTTLKRHQVDGLSWLAKAWQTGRPGALLADDMGLGKTLQTLSFLCWMRENNLGAGPVLVVAPTGLLAGWQAEVARHLLPGALGPIIRAYGDGLARLRQGQGTDISTGTPKLDSAAMRDAGVVLTTYETLRDYHFSFASLGVAVAVFDEAQRIKNPAAQVTRAAKTLRARFTLALSGTPVENRMQDLWSIVDVIHPGLLGSSKAFEARYGEGGVDRLRELNDALTTPAPPWPAFMLRRMKGDHLEGLPEKRVVRRDVTMPPAQAAAYSAAVNRAMALRGSSEREAIVQTLARLRSVSLAPRLPEIGEAFTRDSARLQAMMAILDEVKALGEKALIFCESLELQPRLASELRRRYALDHQVSCIAGDVAGDERQERVNAFQAREPGFDVMILSPRAGGVGLTITAANHVIHLSRWWNPAVEDQATDRVYRIGQTQPVTVWIPRAIHPDPAINAASFDRKLDDLLERKRGLARNLLAAPEESSDAATLLADVLLEGVTEPSPVLDQDNLPATEEQATAAPAPALLRDSWLTKNGQSEIDLEADRWRFNSLQVERKPKKEERVAD